MRVSKYVSGAVRQSVYRFAHGTAGYPLLEGIDYLDFLREEKHLCGQVLILKRTSREAQYIRSCCDTGYMVESPFELWETELHPTNNQ